MHSDASRHPSINRTSRTELGNRYGHICRAACLFSHSGPLLTKKQQAAFRQFRSLNRDRTRHIVHRNNSQIILACPVHHFAYRRMMQQVLVTICHHRPATIPTFSPHNMDGLHQKSIRGAYDGSDIRIVLEVLNRDMQRVPTLVQIRDDCLHGPVAVRVHDVATVALAEKRLIELFPHRAWLAGVLNLPRADTNPSLEPLRRPLARRGLEWSIARCTVVALRIRNRPTGGCPRRHKLRIGQRPTTPPPGKPAPWCRCPSPQHSKAYRRHLAHPQACAPSTTYRK